MQNTAHHKAPKHHGVHLHTEGFAHPVDNVEALGVDKNMRIADFGAGSGHYSLELAKRLDGTGHVYAIDVQQDLLRRIQNEANRLKLKNIAIIWGDLENAGGSKIVDHHVDLVLMSNILFQIGDKSVIFEEAYRILKPSGRLAIIDWSESFRNMGPHPESVVTKVAAHNKAVECGFELLKEFPAGAHHYGLLFRVVRRKL
jgi:ubiquinone/menaquinone biosynthesis C-methylase UbiE